MIEPLQHLWRPLLRRQLAPDAFPRDPEFEQLGRELKTRIDRIFGRSLAIREVDTGSDNAAEIEMNNLTSPYYDIERFGVTIVASPRHADVLAVTGAVTLNLETALIKTLEAVPAPRLVIAVGDDACDGGIFKNTYAVRGGVDRVIKVDARIPGNPPSPTRILQGLVSLMAQLKAR